MSRTCAAPLRQGSKGFSGGLWAHRPREEILDRPLATLYALHGAAGVDNFPAWARTSRQGMINGILEKDLVEAISLARGLVG